MDSGLPRPGKNIWKKSCNFVVGQGNLERIRKSGNLKMNGYGRPENKFIVSRGKAGLPRSEKNIRKMKFFPGQGNVREICGWPGKFKKDLESQGKVRKFENKWLWQAVFRKFIYFVQEGKGHNFLMR